MTMEFDLVNEIEVKAVLFGGISGRSYENQCLFSSHSLSSACHSPDGKGPTSLGAAVKKHIVKSSADQ